MPTPEQLRKLSEKGKAEKAKKETQAALIRKAELAKQAIEKLEKDQALAKQVISAAESAMEYAAEDGLNAVLIYHIERDDVVEIEGHSLGSGSKVDMRYKGETHAYQGVAKIIIDHFRNAGFEAAVVTKAGPPNLTGPSPNEYYIKVGW